MRDFTDDLRWLAINSATIKAWPLDQQIEGLRASRHYRHRALA